MNSSYPVFAASSTAAAARDCMIDGAMRWGGAPVGTIVNALAMWGGQWSPAIPPVDATGDAESDELLSRVFNDMLALSTGEAMAMIERLLFDVVQFPRPDAVVEPWRPVLMRWWLQIFEAAR